MTTKVELYNFDDFDDDVQHKIESELSNHIFRAFLDKGYDIGYNAVDIVAEVVRNTLYGYMGGTPFPIRGYKKIEVKDDNK